MQPMAGDFDPEAAAAPGSGIFGLDCGAADAAVVLLPVPFHATASYGAGTVDGPAAILAASRQVDLFDVQTGRPYEAGIHMLPEDPGLRRAALEARELAHPLLAKGGAEPGDEDILAQVDAAGAMVESKVYTGVREILERGALPGVVGGDHSVVQGGIRAVLEEYPEAGLLQIDAHADLRVAYEGFRFSHASIMDNVLQATGLQRLVQVGIRDLSESEMRRGAEDPRIVQHLDMVWRQRLARGETFAGLCDEAVAALPEEVYVSFDIDGLDPALCPHTGTPVPGGLGFAECCILLQAVVDAGRRIVGFDLNEVAPGPAGDEWDGNVGARVLYKLCGFALLSQAAGAD